MCEVSSLPPPPQEFLLFVHPPHRDALAVSVVPWDPALLLGPRRYVCQDTFVYHDKSATASPEIRAAMEKNKLQVNKKGQAPGHQS